MKYFTQFYSNKTDGKNENNDNIRIIVVSNEVVSETVLKLTNRKFPGKDTTANEMSKFGGNKLII
jgi:hypothetical protein